MPVSTHEEYFATLPPDVRIRMVQIQAEIERLAPGTTRCISYGMAAFRDKRIFIYFGAFAKHIGVYPPLTSEPRLIEETSRFRGPKGILSFSLDEPLPLDLIGRVAMALLKQYSAK